MDRARGRSVVAGPACPPEDVAGCLHVCGTCRPMGATVPVAGKQGAADLVAFARRVAAHFPTGTFGIQVYPCLGGCTRRGRFSVSAPGRWSWLFAGIDPETDGDTLLMFLRAWLSAPAGLVDKKERSSWVKMKSIGRVPPA